MRERLPKRARQRCTWAESSEAERAYHDEEWGVPLRDERGMFEFLTLEGAQAGLSWALILRKREGYRRAFADFDVEKVARFRDARIEKLLEDPSIVRNRLKVTSVRDNARAALALRREGTDLARFLWGFVDGEPLVQRPRTAAEVPSRTKLSDRISRELKRRGFRFVGSTICYALMQATGLVDDHEAGCFRARGRRKRHP
jgi:DNA-3-methyladenine glycosylase I